jgi:hypothetical protein
LSYECGTGFTLIHAELRFLCSDMSSQLPPVGYVPENAPGYEDESSIMLFATAIGGRSCGKEQDEAQTIAEVRP